MFTSLKRIFHFGWKNFSRDPGATTACIFILVVVISLITSLYLFQAVSQFLIKTVQEKVDVSVYFKEESSEEEISEISQKISEISAVKSTEYISKEKALQKFEERHKDDPLLMESLEELGINPFLASLNIRAFDSSQYESITKFLEQSQFNPLIYKIDYYQKKPILEKLLSINSQINRFGIIFSIILGIIAISVAFNQIQMAFYNSKQEIGIMRLVGASNWFIKGPFIVQGLIIGTFAVLVTLLIFSGILFGFSSKIETSLAGFNLLGFFTGHFLTILLMQLIIGIGIGVFASSIAIRKYLKV